MPELVFLGTACAIPDREHENTHLALCSRGGVVLVDCAGTPLVRLEQAGIGLHDISDLILTHHHPDHVAAVPVLLTNLWLLGRQEPIRLYGLIHCLERMETVMATFSWKTLPNRFDLQMCHLQGNEREPVLDWKDLRVHSTPVRHLVPTIGLRFESSSGRAVAYSSDTEPCREVIDLAAGAEVLIHEATGEGEGHSSGKQAGEVAEKAGVGRLLLIHYPTDASIMDAMLQEARGAFSGPVDLATDLMRIVF